MALEAETEKITLKHNMILLFVAQVSGRHKEVNILRQLNAPKSLIGECQWKQDYLISTCGFVERILSISQLCEFD